MTELTTGQTVKQSVRTMGLNLGDRFKIASAKTKGAGSKEIDVAILKSTSARFHVVPKEKHVANLKFCISGSRSSSNYIARGLLKRLHSSTDWLTTLKSLITIHRLIRETDPASFMEELLRVGEPSARGRGGRVLAVDNFLDMTNIQGRFDFSEWVRAYGKYLDEQLEVFSAIAWHVDLEKSGETSKLKSLSTKDLLQQLPYLQRLQRRLVDCVPRGQAMNDDVVLLSLSMVVRESFRLYKALSEGIINLADKYFSMDYLDATKALEFYKEAISSTEALSGYFTALSTIDAVKRAIEFPSLEPPPADFIGSMEEYLKDAPRPASSAASASTVLGSGGSDGVATGEGDTTATTHGGDGSGVVDGVSTVGDTTTMNAAVPRRTAPLRKGRFSQSHPSSSSTSLHDAASKLKDPGMLLPPGALVISHSTDTDNTVVVEQTTDEVHGNDNNGDVVDNDDSDDKDNQQQLIVVDLLDFGNDDTTTTNDTNTNDSSGHVGVVATTQGDDHQQQQQQQVVPSALDLLNQLDFTSLSVTTTTTTTMNSTMNNGVVSAAAATTPAGASAIHDTFVLRAAADVYGQPTSTPTTTTTTNNTTAMTMMQQQQQPYYMQQQQQPYPPHYHHQQQQQQLVPYGLQMTAASMSLPSPQPQQPMMMSPMSYQQQPYQQQPFMFSPSSTGYQQQPAPWSSTPPSMPMSAAAGDATMNVKEAGAHDPFSSLAGLPQKQQQQSPKWP